MCQRKGVQGRSLSRHARVSRAKWMVSGVRKFFAVAACDSQDTQSYLPYLLPSRSSAFHQLSLATFIQLFSLQKPTAAARPLRQPHRHHCNAQRHHLPCRQHLTGRPHRSPRIGVRCYVPRPLVSRPAARLAGRQASAASCRTTPMSASLPHGGADSTTAAATLSSLQRQPTAPSLPRRGVYWRATGGSPTTPFRRRWR